MRKLHTEAPIGLRHETRTESARGKTGPTHFALRAFDRTPSPYSSRSIGIGLLCFVAALAAHIAFRAAGSSLMFAPYYPAVLVAGLLAGLPAGLFVAVAGLITAWWAFLPPQFSFLPLSTNHLFDFAMYMISSGCVLFVTERYRTILWQLRKHERQRDLVTKELEHRSKNTYAVIDAIVQKTLEDDPDRANILSGRIRAVKFANDILNRTTSYSVLIKSLLLHEFMPYGESRFQFIGPDIELSSDTARHLALVFHELVTNAAKYGALSKPGGRVLVGLQNADGAVKLEWTEEGGPPASPPKKQGFGSRIVTQSLKSLSGSITPVFAPEGLRCTITFRP